MPLEGMQEHADGKLLVRHEGALCFITFNNPERRNALSDVMSTALLEIIGRLSGDDSVRVVVLAGAGSTFSAGADISGPVAPGADRTPRGRGVIRALAALPKPLIASIRGHCLGGGLGIALAADLRIASARSRFGIPAAKLGVAYSLDGLRQLVSIVGPAHARMIMYTGRALGADDALRMGLINQVVADDALDTTVRDLANEIAANAPLSVKSARAGIEQLQRDPGDRDLSAFNQLQADALASEDRREGRRAFAEKRPPEFRGL